MWLDDDDEDIYLRGEKLLMLTFLCNKFITFGLLCFPISPFSHVSIVLYIYICIYIHLDMKVNNRNVYI